GKRACYRLRVKISIVIPAYNEEKYLPQTLDAVKAALTNIKDAEIIVVDNMSTDSTREIAESSGARIVDEHVRNIGKVRNTGAESATGNVIVFLDADSHVRPGTFENIIDAMSDERCVGGSAAVEYGPIHRRVVIGWFMLLWP